jgi:hypothetical protein
MSTHLPAAQSGGMQPGSPGSTSGAGGGSTSSSSSQLHSSQAVNGQLAAAIAGAAVAGLLFVMIAIFFVVTRRRRKKDGLVYHTGKIITFPIFVFPKDMYGTCTRSLIFFQIIFCLSSN